MLNKELMSRGGGDFRIRYCLINNIDANYREPLEVHTDDHGKYILVPDFPVDTPEKLLHREFIGYFGIQGLYDETQNKITLARTTLNPVQPESKYYLTESNNILEPIGLTAVYGLKSPLYYYFSLPAMEEDGIYYADYLGHSGYSYTYSRKDYFPAELCQLSYDAIKGAVCEVPNDFLGWIRMYYQSATSISPIYDNAGTDILPLYHMAAADYEGYYLKLRYNASESGGTSGEGSLYLNEFDTAILNTFSALNLASMRLQFTVSTVDSSHGQRKLKYVTGIEINGTLYYVDTRYSLSIPEGATQFMLYNTNTEYVVYEDANIFPFE